MRLPNWVRAIILISSLMQSCLLVSALLLDPSRIAELWPWKLPPLTARLFGASTLVSVPMSLLAVGINRFVVATIPLVMMLTYRVLQLLAGAIHPRPFPPWTSLVTLNYFGGGLLMAIAFGYPLWAGLRGTLPPAKERSPLSSSSAVAPSTFRSRRSWPAWRSLRGTWSRVPDDMALIRSHCGSTLPASRRSPRGSSLRRLPAWTRAHSRRARQRLARGPCARSRHGDHRHSRHALAGARPRRFRAAKRRRMANGSNAAVAVADRAYASDFQAVAVRWSTARLAALSRGSQPLRARVCRLNPTSMAEELVVPNRLGWCGSENTRPMHMMQREPPQGR